MHVIGEIQEAHGFTDQSAFARFSLNAGPCWRLLEGLSQGQTQLTNRCQIWRDEDNDNDINLEPRFRHPWSHPIDVHYATKGLQGWPRMELQVWGVDWLGKCNICAYGFLAIPLRPGYHELECYTWRPVGDLRRRLIDYVTGQRLQLLDPADIVGAGANRHVIQTESMGTVKVRLTIVLKDFQEFGVDIV